MAEAPKLPDQETFTREELSREWKRDISKIDAYIRSGQLKETLPPAAMRALRLWFFYKCEDREPLLDPFDSAKLDANDSNEWLLNFIENGEPLEKYIGRIAHGKIKHCPEHLYIPIDDEAIIERPDEDYNLVSYFYDLHGNAFIPLEDAENGYRICFAPVKKEHLASLIIRIEEVRRFIGGKKTSSVAAERKYKKAGQGREDSEIATPKTVDKAPDKLPPVPDRLINIKEVKKRVNKSSSFIYAGINKKTFPKGRKDGGSRVWRKSEIDDYVTGRWKPTDDEDSGKASE